MLKRILFGVIAMLVLGALGFVGWAVTGTHPAQDRALAALHTSQSVVVTQDRWIVFDPQAGTETGLIFYPGGLVEPQAYAPILRQVAEHGILVVITPMPLNLAILNTNAADDVIRNFPEVKHWILAGHSLGGAAAAIYVYDKPGNMEALALWDAYPPSSADLSFSSIGVISIFGTTSGIPNPDNFETTRLLLPSNTQFVSIEGANHAQFGDYGLQQGDVVARLNPEEQQSQVARVMIDFINALTNMTLR
jgi:hypothetical protein